MFEKRYKIMYIQVNSYMHLQSHDAMLLFKWSKRQKERIFT